MQIGPGHRKLVTLQSELWSLERRTPSEADEYGGMLKLHLAEHAIEWRKILSSDQLIDWALVSNPETLSDLLGSFCDWQDKDRKQADF